MQVGIHEARRTLVGGVIPFTEVKFPLSEQAVLTEKPGEKSGKEYRHIDWPQHRYEPTKYNDKRPSDMEKK